MVHGRLQTNFWHAGWVCRNARPTACTAAFRADLSKHIACPQALHRPLLALRLQNGCQAWISRHSTTAKRMEATLCTDAGGHAPVHHLRTSKVRKQSTLTSKVRKQSTRPDSIM